MSNEFDSKKGISVCQVARDLEMRRPTVWSVMHRIRKALKTEQAELLKGIFQMDETYIKNINNQNTQITNTPQQNVPNIMNRMMPDILNKTYDPNNLVNKQK